MCELPSLSFSSLHFPKFLSKKFVVSFCKGLQFTSAACASLPQKSACATVTHPRLKQNVNAKTFFFMPSSPFQSNLQRTKISVLRLSSLNIALNINPSNMQTNVNMSFLLFLFCLSITTYILLFLLPFVNTSNLCNLANIES
jgi:hypothetical protein